MSTLVVRFLGALALVSVFPAAAAPAADRPDLVVAVNAEPIKLEPADTPRAVDMRATYSIFDTLIRRGYRAEMASDGTEVVLEPGLATAWRYVDDRTLELELRQGVTFHDGRPFTAADVAFTFGAERMFGEAPLLPTAARYVGDFEAVEIIDDHKVRIRARAPDPNLPLRLSVPAAGIVSAAAYAEKGVDGFKRAPVGTGPLSFVEWRAGQVVRFEAFDHYWDGPPHFETVTFQVVPEVAARVAGLVSGDFDLVIQLTPDQIGIVEAHENLEMRHVVMPTAQMLWLVGTDPVLDDARIRRALSLAIDRELLIETLWAGFSEIPHGYQIPAFGPLFDPSREGFAYDPEGARTLLADAGYAGERVVLRQYQNYYPNGDAAAQAVQAMWQEVGVNAVLEFGEGWPQVYEPGRSVSMGSFTYRFPAPESMAFMFFGPESIVQSRHGFLNTDEFNRLAAEIQQLGDPVERKAIYDRMHSILMTEMPGTPLYFQPQFYGLRKDLEWRPYPDYIMDFGPQNLSVEAAASP